LAELSEFRGVRYNPAKVQSMRNVICPPYDVISPQEQQALYDSDKYNMVRLEYGLEQEGDNERDNRYTRARDTFNQWLKEGVLMQDQVPNYYVHEHNFEIGETRKKRLELYACVRLEPWENRVIFPHEFTMAKAKANRLDLMKSCSADFSPIFGLYEDPGGKINQLIVNRVKSTPTYNFQHGDSHRFWMVNEPEFVQRERMLGVLELLEAKGWLKQVIDWQVTEEGVRVIIGGENRESSLHDLSLVVSNYGVPDQARGTVGVIGPKRMDYSKAISAVNYISGLLSELVARVCRDD